jgi:hypothetical protein
VERKGTKRKRKRGVEKQRGEGSNGNDIERNSKHCGDADNEATENDDEETASHSSHSDNGSGSDNGIHSKDSPRTADDSTYNYTYNDTNSNTHTKIPRATAAAFRRRISNFELFGYALVALGFCVCIPSVLLVMFAQQNLTYVPE